MSGVTAWLIVIVTLGVAVILTTGITSLEAVVSATVAVTVVGNIVVGGVD